jgi:hypothetical protein
MPNDLSDLEDPITGNDRSEKEIVRDVVLPYCLSGVGGGEGRRVSPM